MYTKDILVGDKKITLSTGKIAPQTNASVVAQYGNTTVLATVLDLFFEEMKSIPFLTGVCATDWTDWVY